MNALIILLVAIAVLVCGYVFYGGWLAKQWGIDPNRPTPAHEFEDGKDYVPAAPYVVLGHHFSSIAGAGPVNGPIQAAIFGWVPVLLWVFIGGIFFGAMARFRRAVRLHPPQGADARDGHCREHRRHGQEAVLHLLVPDAHFGGGRLRLHRGEHLCCGTGDH